MHLKEYIDLEQMRFQDTLKVKFQTKNIDNQKMIPPMFLIPFVENAFKHGNLIDGFLLVDIKIQTTKDTLLFKIKNTVKPDNDSDKKPGIGLENIKKRLDLTYPNKYDLKVRTEQGWYFVDLLIENLNDD